MSKQLLLGAFITVLLSACNTQSVGTDSASEGDRSSSNCQTVQHEAGETQVCGQPQRIVVLNPKMLDLVLSLNVQPVGYAEIFSNRQGDFDQPSQQIPALHNGHMRAG